MLARLRKASSSSQRGQRPSSSPGDGRETKPQTPHPCSPSCIAVKNIGVEALELTTSPRESAPPPPYAWPHLMPIRFFPKLPAHRNPLASRQVRTPAPPAQTAPLPESQSHNPR